jgi:hypothetical protein
LQDIEKPAGDSSARGKPYAVQDGKVNATTYTRWLRYSAFCRTCHGTGGVGSAIVPDLTQVVKSLNKRQFEMIVSSGLEGNSGNRRHAGLGQQSRYPAVHRQPGPICAQALMASSAPAVHRKSARKMKHRARSAAAKHNNLSLRLGLG